MRSGVKHAVIWKRKGSGTESSECKGPEAEAFLMGSMGVQSREQSR